MMYNSRQFAYRPGVGGVTAAMILKETILKYTSEGSNVHCCMVDFKKAFDYTNLSILVSKMSDTSVPPLIVSLIKSIYDNTFIGVKFNNASSAEDWEANNGVRQGAVCSGLLFTFYINEIIETISKLNEGCNLSTYKVNILGYADDIVLIAPTRKALQVIVNKLYELSSKLCLSINVNKTVYLVFKKEKNEKIVSEITINDSAVTRAANCKYLGMHFSEDLSLDLDVARVNRKFLSQFNGMYYKFNFVDTNQLLFLYDAYCTSFFGCELWHDVISNDRNFKTVTTSVHNAIKRMINLPKQYNSHDMARMANVLLFKHFLASRMLSYLFNVIKSKSPCLTPLRHYFVNESFLCKNIKNHFLLKYQINDLFSNSLCALKSRIAFVQNHEASSGFIPHFMR